jgi:sortase B
VSEEQLAGKNSNRRHAKNPEKIEDPNSDVLEEKEGLDETEEIEELDEFEDDELPKSDELEIEEDTYVLGKYKDEVYDFEFEDFDFDEDEDLELDDDQKLDENLEPDGASETLEPAVDEPGYQLGRYKNENFGPEGLEGLEEVLAAHGLMDDEDLYFPDDEAGDPEPSIYADARAFEGNEDFRSDEFEGFIAFKDDENLEFNEALKGLAPLPSTSSTRVRRTRPPAPAQKPKKERTGLSRLSLILGIVFLAIALGIIVFLFYKYASAHEDYSQIAVSAGFDKEAATDVVAPDVTATDLDINWSALKEINPDIVGWVMIPGTRINYPIVQAVDNSYYLNHLVDKTPSDVGAIFLDYENDQSITGWNNMIYGHNLLDGSMFASLKQYQDKAYFDAHKKILLATPEKVYTLDVVATLVCDDKDEVRRFGFTDKADYEDYVRMLLGYAVLSELEVGEIPETLYCFATCTDTNYAKRTVVCATFSASVASEGNE